MQRLVASQVSTHHVQPLIRHLGAQALTQLSSTNSPREVRSLSPINAQLSQLAGEEFDKAHLLHSPHQHRQGHRRGAQHTDQIVPPATSNRTAGNITPGASPKRIHSAACHPRVVLGPLAALGICTCHCRNANPPWSINRRSALHMRSAPPGCCAGQPNQVDQPYQGTYMPWEHLE